MTQTISNGARRIDPVIFGVTGLGGYGGRICRLLLDSGAHGYADGAEPYVKLAAVCEPDLARHADAAGELRARGVAVVQLWEDFLALPTEAVWLPLPIPLHRPYTEQALAAGKAVMCEKPAAGSVQDVDAMIAARDRAQLPAAIGFQDMYRPSTAALKEALLAGRIGRVRSATLMACWPRDSNYYGRSLWAGRQQLNGSWVLDSPANNALAHYVSLALFLLGQTRDQSAALVRVEAELYRAKPIENYDTCGIRVATETDATVLVLFTHACRETHNTRIVIEGERGKLIYEPGLQAVIETPDGIETVVLRDENLHGSMVDRFARLVRGIPDDRCTATFEVARAHTVAINGASEASPVRDVPLEFVETLPSGEDGHVRVITGIEELFRICAETQRLPHETGLAAWTQPAGRKNLGGYRYFAGPAQE